MTPLLLEGTAIGCVHSGWLDRLLTQPSPFRLQGQGLSLIAPLPTFSSRSAVLATWAEQVREHWGLPGWRDERIVVREQGQPQFSIERSLLRPLGLLLPSVQASVYTLTDEGPRIWIARRAASKPVDPGCLDALVAGGISGFDDAMSTLVRECEEEAGIAAKIALTAQATGSIDVTYDTQDHGLTVTHRERIALHDLAVPADFVPVNRDGEHEAILAMSPMQAWLSMDQNAWTPDGAQATRALIERHGWLPRETLRR